MGGYNAGGVFELAEHKCGRTNDVHQRRIDEFMKILQEYAEPPTRDASILSQRLSVALEKLRQTELWVRFKTDKDKELEMTEGSEDKEEVERTEDSDDDSIEQLMEDSEEENPKACNGCAYARIFYKGGPLTLICCLDEDFAQHKHKETDRPTCRAAMDAIKAEIPTAMNIQQHSKELYLE